MKIRTALVRSADGSLHIKRYDDYRSNRDFADDLQSNGFRVLKIWAENKDDAEVDDWELLNRK